jgi:hypothetical protein
MAHLEGVGFRREGLDDLRTDFNSGREVDDYA